MPSAEPSSRRRARASRGASKTASTAPPTKSRRFASAGISTIPGGYETALNKRVPLVLVLGDDACEWCWKYVDSALTCPSVNRLAGYAAFAVSRPKADSAAGRLAKALEIGSVPAVSVIAPDAEKIKELGRLNGYFPGDTLARELTRIFTKNGHRVPGPGGSKAYAALTPLSKPPVDNSAACAGGQ